jgi:transposase-like protein
MNILSRFDNLDKLYTYFNSQAKCIHFIEQWLYPDGQIPCPYCGSVHTYQRGDSHRHICKDCGGSFSILQRTIFENTKLPLRKWFAAIYLFSAHKKGISSHQLHRDLGVTQKTAWYMLQRIRMLVGQNPDYVLKGDVEIDETYFGGKEAFKHESKKAQPKEGKGKQNRGLSDKVPVFGMVERGGKAVVIPLENTRLETIYPIIKRQVSTSANVYTDESHLYKGLVEQGFVNHSTVNHSKKEYKRGRSTTNTVEGMWSHFNRMVTGVYHHVSKEHLYRYIDESTFRWNTRKWNSAFRFAEMFRNIGNVVRQWDCKAA